ncbi:hypothetical protein BBJ28_00019229 [Nothophytophthora sp. Chile5]|nr:hypothetical protein BBJ28_00019229 [Nothophytophthora sp. Chile5]
MDQTDQDSAPGREWKPVNAAHVLPLVLDTDDVGRDDSDQRLPEFRGTHEGSRMEGRIGVIKKRQPVPKTPLSLSSKEGSFVDVFGAFGVLMVTIFVVSALWTFTLACIQLYPTEMANAIMNTSKFDNGDFWLLPQPSAAFVGTSVFLLVLFGLGYFGISALLDFPKLIFQTTTLLTYLRNGFPTPLIYFYSSFLLVNWIVGFARYRHRNADPNFVIARLFYT